MMISWQLTKCNNFSLYVHMIPAKAKKNESLIEADISRSEMWRGIEVSWVDMSGLFIT